MREPASAAAALGLGLTAGALGLLSCGDDARVEPPPPSVCEGYSEGPGGARYFAVQPRLEPSAWVSYEAFRAHIDALVAERVTPCLATDRDNVLVFPENAGLHAAFLGSRGAAAREAPSSAAAFLGLSSAYAEAIARYEERFGPLPVPTGIELALTDAMWRAFEETYAGVARDTGAYVIANADIARVIVASSDPEDLAVFGDPDRPDASEVYVAATPEVYNTAYVFAPDGSVVATRSKPYLVPSEEGQLALQYGSLTGVSPVSIAGARVGIVTSKDAWMPDVLDRLALLEADVLAQPEAFSGWGIEELPGDWLPLIVQQSGWAATQKYASLRFSVIPHMTGNLFDLVFDGQSLIATDAPDVGAAPAYVGLEPMPGVLQVAPWLAEDPGLVDPSLSLEQRRAELRAHAEAALPGAANDNGYVDAVLAADLDLAPWQSAGDAEAGALGASARLSAAGASGSEVDVAADGATVVAAWAQREGGARTLVVARSADGGQTFAAPVVVASSDRDQTAPAVAVRGEQVVVVWQELGPGSRVLAARSDDGGQTFAEAEAPAEDLAIEPPDEWLPDVAISDSGEALVALVALVSDNERVVVARRAGAAWSSAVVESAPARAPRNTRNNQWGPAISASGADVAVAWVDFRDFNWDVYGARSADGGLTFTPPVRIDDGSDEPERIHADVDVLHADGELWVAWTDVRLRLGPSRVRLATWPAAQPSASIVVSDEAPSAWGWRPSLSQRGGALAVAWQGLVGGEIDVFVARLEQGEITSTSRLDDGAPPSQQFAPRLAWSDAGLVAAWEDTREGTRAVRRAGPLP